MDIPISDDSSSDDSSQLRQAVDTDSEMVVTVDHGYATKNGKVRVLPTKKYLKGKGITATVRHRKNHQHKNLDKAEGVTKPAIRRLARRGGVKRISGCVYEDAREALTTWLKDIVKSAVTYTEHARRKTVSSHDVIHALGRSGQTIYGFP